MMGLRFKEGGWVLLGAAILFLAIVAWATAPAILKMTTRPPGDGADVASYQFDLSNMRLPTTAVLEPAMLHRDMVPVLDAPYDIRTAQDVIDVSATRAKYLVDDDPVIGVTIGTASRAYPISMLNVHEMVHDELGGTPILITWHWPSASPRVFDRRIDGSPHRFGVSGLMAGGNLAFYPRHPTGTHGGEPLYSQLLGRTFTGPPNTLTAVPHQLCTWQEWHAAHPETTVAGRDPALKKRYKHADPSAYYMSGGLISSSDPPEDGPPPKSPTLLIGAPPQQVIVWTPDQGFSASGPWEVVDASPPHIRCSHCDAATGTRQTLWHAAHALGLTEPRP